MSDADSKATPEPSQTDRIGETPYALPEIYTGWLRAEGSKDDDHILVLVMRGDQRHRVAITPPKGENGEIPPGGITLFTGASGTGAIGPDWPRKPIEEFMSTLESTLVWLLPKEPQRPL